jgi:hypothetical protein
MAVMVCLEWVWTAVESVWNGGAVRASWLWISQGQDSINVDVLLQVIKLSRLLAAIVYGSVRGAVGDA